jgi:[acyl-carrier-protein] S-malonyltransferase
VNAATFVEPRIPVVGNVHAMPIIDPIAARADVMAQMQSRVRWVDSVRFMQTHGVSTFVEVGTGAVLAGLIKRIVEGITVLPLGNPQDFEALK